MIKHRYELGVMLNEMGLTTKPITEQQARTVANHFMALEEKIAAFKKVEACVVFQSGFAANAGTVAAILGWATAVAAVCLQR